MNSEPCVRFGMRISPKISEKPADSRNSRPPKATLLTVSTQKFMDGIFLEQALLAQGVRCRLSQAMQQTLFPSPACGEGGSRGAIASASRERACSIAAFQGTLS